MFTSFLGQSTPDGLENAVRVPKIFIRMMLMLGKTSANQSVFITCFYTLAEPPAMQLVGDCS